MRWACYDGLILPISTYVEWVIVEFRSTKLVVGTVCTVDHRPLTVCFLEEIQKNLEAILKFFPGFSIVAFDIHHWY